MDTMKALEALSALGQQTRLDVFRRLVQAGSQGMTAGEIGAALNVRQNTMSTNLAVLLRAHLVRNTREGRTVRYFADMEGVRDLIAFLLEDCCGGRPDVCQPVLDSLICEC